MLFRSMMADLSNFEKKGSNTSKGIFKPEPLPYDAPLEGLGDYYSIQRDYPRVYRIGDGGLSAQATDEEVGVGEVELIDPAFEFGLHRIANERLLPSDVRCWVVDDRLNVF